MRTFTADEKKKGIAIAAFALVAAGIVYYQVLDTNPTPAPAAVATAPARVAQPAKVPAQTGAGGSAAKKNAAMPVTELDPTLKMGSMLVAESVVYSGNGRNIFSMTSAPIEIPKPVAPPRPMTPPPPQAPVYTGPPPPPPIDLKFFGTATANSGNRQAFLLHGDDVFLASAGDVVQRRYRVVSMTANSIVVEDLTNNNRQTLPLIVR